MGYCQGVFFNLFWKLKTFCWTFNKTLKPQQDQNKYKKDINNMGGCRCIFRDCHVNSASYPGMHFFHFPIKQKEKLNLWIKYAKAQHILTLTPSQMKNKVICSTHFRDECFMNYKKDRLTREAIPTLIRLNKPNMVLDFEKSDDPTPTKLPKTTAKHLLPPQQLSKRDKEEQEDNNDEESIEIEKPEEIFLESIENDTAYDNIYLQPSISKTKSINCIDDDITENYFSIIGLDKEELEHEKVVKVLNKNVNNNDDEKEELSTPPPLKKTKIFSTAPKILNRDASPTIHKTNTTVNNKSKSNSPNAKRKTILLNGTKTIKLYKNPKRTLQKCNNNNNMKKVNRTNVIDYDEPTIINMEEIDTTPIFIDKDNLVMENVEKITNDILDKVKFDYEKVIEELKDKLKAKDDEIIKVTQIETVSTSKQSVQTSPQTLQQPKQLTKGQLFNGIKKYLCPSMSALVRMEMFSEPERDWKYDEKQAAVELLQLGETVFDYFRDEWRFRLPPKKDVEQWMSANANIDDDEDL